MNFAILSFIIGFILQFEALFLLLPWIVGMIYGEYHVALIYLVTAAVCFIFPDWQLADRLWNGFSDRYCRYHLLQKLWRRCPLPVMRGKQCGWRESVCVWQDDESNPRLSVPTICLASWKMVMARFAASPATRVLVAGSWGGHKFQMEFYVLWQLPAQKY